MFWGRRLTQGCQLFRGRKVHHQRKSWLRLWWLGRINQSTFRVELHVLERCRDGVTTAAAAPGTRHIHTRGVLVCWQTFVFKNNIYFQKNPFMTPVRLTDDHSPRIRNGIADWLYERTHICIGIRQLLYLTVNKDNCMIVTLAVDGWIAWVYDTQQKWRSLVSGDRWLVGTDLGRWQFRRLVPT